MDGFAVSDVDELRQLMHESLRGVAGEMGVQVAASLLEHDVVKLCGKKNSRDPARENSRRGSQPGYVILGGQKVAIRRPRVRSIGAVEVDLDVYASLQSADAMPNAALTRMVRGVSCRYYEAVVETARAGFGVKKMSRTTSWSCITSLHCDRSSTVVLAPASVECLERFVVAGFIRLLWWRGSIASNPGAMQ
jgi:hypothetical protein